MKSPIDQLRDALKIKRTPAQQARMYDRHNARCHELGLDRQTNEQLQGQGCQYQGGYPVSLPNDALDHLFEIMGAR